MGIYLNPSNEMFKKALRNTPYVDKSGMIAELNKLINTNDCYVCISRPRRFGKTMAANMAELQSRVSITDMIDKIDKTLTRELSRRS
ncbi:MAG: AAA family ATPase [Lachnospiraceae bacterium]|jgi:uncharacterized protein HemX|nr:AAA family ATPase [Lachnospiraceae bacterium]